MSFDDVTQLIGEPGDYRLAPRPPLEGRFESGVVNWEEFAHRWVADDAELKVVFDKRNHVLMLECADSLSGNTLSDYCDKFVRFLGF